MKHFKNLLFTFFLLPLFSLGQSNYKPGFVITLKGDTLRGFINFKEWESNPTAISFKTTFNERKYRSFTVNDIGVFNVDGLAAYKKYSCIISMDETNIARLSSGRDSSFRIDTVFLKILQKGKNVALYSYEDHVKTRFYIGEAVLYAPTELIYKTYFNTGNVSNNGGTTVVDNTFLKQLFALATKYNVLDDNLTTKFQKSGYTKDDLMAIVSKINDISKKEIATKYTDHEKLNFYVGAALNISTTSSNVSAPYTLGGGIPYTSYLPAVSFGVNVIPKPSTARVELRADLTLAETQFKPSYQLKVSPYVVEKASFTQYSIAIVPQMIYNFYNTENLKFYGGVGFGLTFSFFSDAFLGSQNPNISDNGIGASDPYYFNADDALFLFKAGAKINKKFEIFGAYYSNTIVTRGGYFQFINSNKQIGFIYLLGK